MLRTMMVFHSPSSALTAAGLTVFFARLRRRVRGGRVHLHHRDAVGYGWRCYCTISNLYILDTSHLADVPSANRRSHDDAGRTRHGGELHEAHSGVALPCHRFEPITRNCKLGNCEDDRPQRSQLGAGAEDRWRRRGAAWVGSRGNGGVGALSSEASIQSI